VVVLLASIIGVGCAVGFATAFNIEVVVVGSDIFSRQNFDGRSNRQV
jgi:hypothetical protein